jgi:hypothetical protein
MYVDFTKEELYELRQYWYSKYCNEVCVPEKKVFYALYQAYDNLINFPNKEYKNAN